MTTSTPNKTDAGDGTKDICERLLEYRAFVSPESRTLNLEAAAEIERLREMCSPEHLKVLTHNLLNMGRASGLQEAANIVERLDVNCKPNRDRSILVKRHAAAIRKALPGCDCKANAVDYVDLPRCYTARQDALEADKHREEWKRSLSEYAQGHSGAAYDIAERIRALKEKTL